MKTGDLCDVRIWFHENESVAKFLASQSHGTIPSRLEDAQSLLCQVQIHHKMHISSASFRGTKLQINNSNSVTNSATSVAFVNVYSGPSDEITLCLGNQFKDFSFVGKGAYGHVYKATRILRGRPNSVAIKVFGSKILDRDIRAEFNILQRINDQWVICPMKIFLQCFHSNISGVPRCFDLVTISDGPRLFTCDFIEHDNFQV